MSKKKKSSMNKHSERPSKKHENKNPDKRYPNPDQSYEETGASIKEKPIKSGPDHPHQEEILDGIPR